MRILYPISHSVIYTQLFFLMRKFYIQKHSKTKKDTKKERKNGSIYKHENANQKNEKKKGKLAN